MKIGIMGGTFDPIHNGHLMLGETAYKQFHLDEVWFMPNGNPPHKNKITIGSDVNDRLKMVELAIAGKDYFRLEDYEARKIDVSCSYATLEYMKQKHPDNEFYFIIGADSLFSIERWVKPERIFPTCTILAAFRDDIDTCDAMNRQINYLKDKYQAKIELLISPLIRISSSEIREGFRTNHIKDEYLPESVKAYIAERGLYGSENC